METECFPLAGHARLQHEVDFVSSLRLGIGAAGLVSLKERVQADAHQRCSLHTTNSKREKGQDKPGVGSVMEKLGFLVVWPYLTACSRWSLGAFLRSLEFILGLGFPAESLLSWLLVEKIDLLRPWDGDMVLVFWKDGWGGGWGRDSGEAIVLVRVVLPSAMV